MRSGPIRSRTGGTRPGPARFVAEAWRGGCRKVAGSARFSAKTGVFRGRFDAVLREKRLKTSPKSRHFLPRIGTFQGFALTFPSGATQAMAATWPERRRKEGLAAFAAGAAAVLAASRMAASGLTTKGHHSRKSGKSEENVGAPHACLSGVSRLYARPFHRRVHAVPVQGSAPVTRTSSSFKTRRGSTGKG